MKDLDKLEPSIYIITSNRSAGKTTAFLIKVLKHFHETGRKFILLYRYTYELNGSADLFKDVLRIYPDLGEQVTSESRNRGLYYELYLDGKSCGFSLSLNNPDALKKYSAVFTEVDWLVMDEFMTETGKYLTQEVNKLQSVLLTVARGGGEQSRNVKLVLLGNFVTIMNPYFIQFDIHKRLKPDTNFMRGRGWVAEFGFNQSASESIKANGIFRAFENESYMAYSTEKQYLIDANIFIDKPTGKARYLCTIVHDGVGYGVREYKNEGLLHVSKKIDGSCKTVITFKASDHNQNTIMLNHFSYTWKYIRESYQRGILRFEDIKCKNAIFDILAVDLYK